MESSTAETKPHQPRLAIDHVTLLHPDAVTEKRLANMDDFAAVIRSATDAVIAYDAAHPDDLPPALDLVVVARPHGVRCWLVAAKGDLSVPEMETAFANLPKVTVREGNVAAVEALVRTGTSDPSRAPYLPAAWKLAAGKNGTDIDQVIDTVWPR